MSRIWPGRHWSSTRRVSHAIRRGVVKRLNLKLIIYTNLANDCWALGDLDQAIALYQESLDLLQDTTNSERRAGIYWGLSLAHKAKEDLVRAVLYGRQALEALEATGDARAVAQMRVNLAEIETLRGSYEAAAGLLDAGGRDAGGRGRRLGVQRPV